MLDWDDLRFFLAVARQGSLTAAARALGVAQPTVGRRVAALEARLGAELFVATPSGQALSATGRAMLAHAERMEQDALAAERLASGSGAGLRGAVRVTASEWLIDRVLAPLLSLSARQFPLIEVELLADTRHFNLAQREADIAVRPSKFEHQQIVQRSVASVAFGLYASAGYLAERGMPDFARQCEGHALIAMSESLGRIPDATWLPALAARARVVARANGRLPMVTLAAAGVGMAVLPRLLGDAAAGLRLLEPPTPGPRRKLWLGVHGDARDVPRVGAVLGLLAEGIGRLRLALDPSPTAHTSR